LRSGGERLSVNVRADPASDNGETISQSPVSKIAPHVTTLGQKTTTRTSDEWTRRVVGGGGGRSGRQQRREKGDAASRAGVATRTSPKKDDILHTTRPQGFENQKIHR
jgi:hypothetical protein